MCKMRDIYRALWNSRQEGGMVGDGVKNLWWWQSKFVQYNSSAFSNNRVSWNRDSAGRICKTGKYGKKLFLGKTNH